MTRELKFGSDFEALIGCLSLAINAPTDGEADQATELAERIAAVMDEVEVAAAKERAADIASLGGGTLIPLAAFWDYVADRELGSAQTPQFGWRPRSGVTAD